MEGIFYEGDFDSYIHEFEKMMKGGFLDFEDPIKLSMVGYYFICKIMFKNFDGLFELLNKIPNVTNDQIFLHEMLLKKLLFWEDYFMENIEPNISDDIYILYIISHIIEYTMNKNFDDIINKIGNQIRCYDKIVKYLEVYINSKSYLMKMFTYNYCNDSEKYNDAISVLSDLNKYRYINHNYIKVLTQIVYIQKGESNILPDLSFVNDILKKYPEQYVHCLITYKLDISFHIIRICDEKRVNVKEFEIDTLKICGIDPNMDFTEIIEETAKRDLIYFYLKKANKLDNFLKFMKAHFIKYKDVIDVLMYYLTVLSTYEYIDEFHKIYTETGISEKCKDIVSLTQLTYLRLTNLCKTHKIQEVIKILEITDIEIVLIPKIKNISDIIKNGKLAIMMYGFIICDSPGNDESMIYNDDGEFICSICFENINSETIPIILCPVCNKYVGHFICFTKWLCEKPECPRCRYIS